MAKHQKKNATSPIKEYGIITREYDQPTIIKRLEAFFLDNIGKVVTREQIIKVATDPKTRKEPENWHQRLSELRTDHGYTILSWRDRKWLKVGEYLMEAPTKNVAAGKRVMIDPLTWKKVLENANYTCEWKEGGNVCGLEQGSIDPVGGGTVKLTPDHKTPHSVDSTIDPTDPNKWRALCGRHQVVKKNYWDNITGKLNVYSIVQNATLQEKRAVYDLLKKYFGDN